MEDFWSQFWEFSNIIYSKNLLKEEIYSKKRKKDFARLTQKNHRKKGAAGQTATPEGPPFSSAAGGSVKPRVGGGGKIR